MMTNDMLALARENQRRARATNVEWDRQRSRSRVAPARGASPGRAVVLAAAGTTDMLAADGSTLTAWQLTGRQAR